MYFQGNVILTDHSYTILSLLRVRTDTDKEVRFAIRETFSRETIKMEQPIPTTELYVYRLTPHCTNTIK